MRLRANSLELIGPRNKWKTKTRLPNENTFLNQVNLDTLMRIPDSYSEVDDTGEADLAFRVNVSTGAPILVGILLEHKSGRDPMIFDQISKYIYSVMKIQDKNRIFSGIPTMAIIFYNGRDNWNPLKIL